MILILHTSVTILKVITYIYIGVLIPSPGNLPSNSQESDHTKSHQVTLRSCRKIARFSPGTFTNCGAPDAKTTQKGKPISPGIVKSTWTPFSWPTPDDRCFATTARLHVVFRIETLKKKHTHTSENSHPAKGTQRPLPCMALITAQRVTLVEDNSVSKMLLTLLQTVPPICRGPFAHSQEPWRMSHIGDTPWFEYKAKSQGKGESQGTRGSQSSRCPINA